MPEMNCCYEIIDEVLLMSPPPIWKHNRYGRRIVNVGGKTIWRLS
jgi:hypothetical protein